MKTKLPIIFIILSFLIIGSAATANAANIQYPVEELGNCKNETDCRTYCDKSENVNICLDFAEKNNLMSAREIEMAKKFLATGNKGPGGCNNRDACEEYCNDIIHIDECISFAEKNNLIPPEELEEAKKVQAAIARGVKPPPCGNKKQCDSYCEDPNHMEECITFGTEAGFIQGKELEDAQKMLQAVKRGVKPPPCKGKDACDEYCSNPDNMEVCMNFAMEAGMMSEQEKADAQKMLQALKKGIKPPNCKSKDACDVYCQQEGHFEECTNFAVAAGFMSEKDAEMVRKTGGKGPGGCKGKDECESFCNNPDNQETCFNFAKDNGMIPEEDLKRMEEGKQQMKQSLGQAPAEVLDCLKTEVGADMVEKMKNGFMPPRELGEKMQICFQKMGPPQGSQGSGGPGEGGMIPPAGQTGPGGCKTSDECKSYCESNPQECQNFQSPPPGTQPGQPPQTGENPTPCQGSDCPQMPLPPPGSSQQFAPGTGPNVPPLPPPSTEPGAGGNLTPGEQVPLAPPTEQTAPAENPPPPPPPPASFLKPQSFLGAVLYVIAKALYSVR